MSFSNALHAYLAAPLTDADLKTWLRDRGVPDGDIATMAADLAGLSRDQLDAMYADQHNN